jgi:3-isopropylmalate dehydrogenase
MGMLASASVGDKTGVYEPIHGSAHDITGKGIANPLASVLSVALLLDISFGLKEEAQTVIDAVDSVLKAGYRTRDIADVNTATDKLLGTAAMGEQILQYLNA